MNAPLFKLERVPTYPSKEDVFKAVLQGLTRKQVEFMMESGRSPFTFQVKAVGQNDDLDLIEQLLNGQPKLMSIKNSQQQQDMKFLREVKSQMSNERSSIKGVFWKWDFFQAEQTIGTEDWDELLNLSIEERLKKYKEEWEKAGMHGTDRWSWAAAMAAALKRGEPMDVHFTANVKNTRALDQWNITVIDKEGVFESDKGQYLLTGSFDPNESYAYLSKYPMKSDNSQFRFRASCDGVIPL